MTLFDLPEPEPRAYVPPPADSLAAKVVIGTSGYSFPDWVGPFYPRGTRPSDFLSYYARHFAAVEVNSSYYHVPSPEIFDLMERKTPDHFRFVVKLHRSMTHEAGRDPATYAEFRAALEPLKEAGKYDGLLAQFPWAFTRTPAHLDHLEALRDLLPGEPTFTEFRHDSWAGEEAAAWLAERDLGFCVVDEPGLDHLMPPVLRVTSDDAYVRLHGRNAERWWGGDKNLRYDYSYGESEMREWIARIGELAERARRTYLFFNNCHAGQAARNAKLMQELLRQQRLPAADRGRTGA